MTDDLLRSLERAWQADRNDEAALDRYLDELRRRGLDPVDALADASNEPWAELLRESIPIVRTRPISETCGRRLLALVWNGNYYVSHVDAYADGAIDAWGFVDRELFAKKLTDRPGDVGPPVVTEVPASSGLSIHNLAWMKAVRGEWPLSRSDLRTAVELVVRASSAKGAPLLDMKGESSEQRGRVRYAKLGVGDAKPYRRDSSGPLVRGEELPVFVRRGSELVLTPWLVYADGLSRLGARGPLVPFDELAARFHVDVTTRAAADETVVLPGLGRFVVGPPATDFVDAEDRIREARDAVAVLRGEPGVHALCRRAFEEYAQEEALAGAVRPEPAALVAARERLRAAYEAVPAHRRMYLGDMDSKDWPIRLALGLERGEDA